jgi:formate dehydrogenase subunit delta
MSSSQHLTQMANDIGNFFRAQGSREEAIAGIANHLNSFWTPSMRYQLTSLSERELDGLDELPQAAVLRLSRFPKLKPKQSPGGDAG